MLPIIRWYGPGHYIPLNNGISWQLTHESDPDATYFAERPRDGKKMYVLPGDDNANPYFINWLSLIASGTVTPPTLEIAEAVANMVNARAIYVELDTEPDSYEDPDVWIWRELGNSYEADALLMLIKLS